VSSATIINRSDRVAIVILLIFIVFLFTFFHEKACRPLSRCRRVQV
jgi:hypothetical protein